MLLSEHCGFPPGLGAYITYANAVRVPVVHVGVDMSKGRHEQMPSNRPGQAWNKDVKLK